MKKTQIVNMGAGENCAVLILTASRLGYAASYTREATEFLRSKKLARPLVGLFQQESNACREFIFANNLVGEASKICDEFIPGPFDVISPDGFSIKADGYFSSVPEALNYFEEWKQRYEIQGYYSSNSGRIELNQLERECTLIRIKY